MAQTTSPDNIPSPDLGDQYALTQDLANIADATQNALIKRANAYTGTTAQRTAFTSTAPVGTVWSDTNGNRDVWKKGSSSWEPIVAPEFSEKRTVQTSLTGSQSANTSGWFYQDTAYINFEKQYTSPPNVVFSASATWGAIQVYSITDLTNTSFRLRVLRLATAPLIAPRISFLVYP